jgi:lipocalin
MKNTVVVFLALLALCFSQDPKPVPIPKLDITKTAGLWYIIMVHPSDRLDPNTFCATWNLTVVNQTTVNSTITFNGGDPNTNDWKVSHNGSVWTTPEDNPYDWVAVDPTNLSWGTFASQEDIVVLLVSRTPTLSNAIVQSQVALLQKEGYSINSTNYVIIPNNHCSGEESLEDI